MRLIIKGSLHFNIFTSLKGRPADDQSFFGCVLSTKLSFCIFFLLSITCTFVTGGRLLWWTEGTSGLPTNAKRASTRKYLKGSGNLSSSAAYNQERLTLLLQHHFCGFQSRAVNNQIKTVLICFKMCYGWSKTHVEQSGISSCPKKSQWSNFMGLKGKRQGGMIFAIKNNEFTPTWVH